MYVYEYIDIYIHHCQLVSRILSRLSKPKTPDPGDRTLHVLGWVSQVFTPENKRDGIGTHLLLKLGLPSTKFKLTTPSPFGFATSSCARRSLCRIITAWQGPGKTRRGPGYSGALHVGASSLVAIVYEYMYSVPRQPTRLRTVLVQGKTSRIKGRRQHRMPTVAFGRVSAIVSDWSNTNIGIADHSATNIVNCPASDGVILYSYILVGTPTCLRVCAVVTSS